MGQGLQICKSFRLQLDVLTNVCDVSQLIVLTWMVFSDGSSEDELLKTIPFHGKPRGEHILQNFYASSLEMNIPLHKFVSVTTDGATAMPSENAGLLRLWWGESAFPDFFTYQYVP
jgi:hypothetical protein